MYVGVPYGLVVRIPAFHAGGPGSIPGVGACNFLVNSRHFDTIFSYYSAKINGSAGVRTQDLSRVRRA